MPFLPSSDDHMAPFHNSVRHRNGRRPIPVQDAVVPAQDALVPAQDALVPAQDALVPVQDALE